MLYEIARFLTLIVKLPSNLAVFFRLKKNFMNYFDRFIDFSAKISAFYKKTPKNINF